MVILLKEKWLLSLIAFVILAGCAQPVRHGMIKDPATGIQYGSVIEKSFFIDPGQFENRQVKISARNVSGDTNYDIRELQTKLEAAFTEKGYEFGKPDEFGIKFDVIIEYSGQIQDNMAMEYGFLGALTGGVAGYRSKARAGEAIGVLSGATLGAIIGSHVTDDTYIIIARVSIGVIDQVKKQGKTVTFSSSPALQDESQGQGITHFREVKTTQIAVFAGGRNLGQREVVYGVKSRLYRIIADII
jgi:hypothetical protein